MAIDHLRVEMPDTRLVRRHFCFATLIGVSCVLFRVPLSNLIRYAISQDIGFHILLVVPVSAYLVYLKRNEVFANVNSSIVPGLALFFVALIAGWIGYIHSGPEYLWLEILALVLLWIAGLTAFYGKHAVRSARFSLLFLLLLIPVPRPVVDRTISFLQVGSAFVASWFFALLHVPTLRDGVVFHIPGLDLEISKECSGIRSSMILLITTLLLAQFTLRSFLSKSLLVLAVVPVVILKNGIRIVMISLLTIYVDRGFLHGWLHRSGGIAFYLLGLAALIPISKLLKTIEIKRIMNSKRA